MIDPVNHPPHYTAHPSGIECIQITEHMGFNLGNAIKYIWRADLKCDAIEDLKKAQWYIDREISKRTKDRTNDQLGLSVTPLHFGQRKKDTSVRNKMWHVACSVARRFRSLYYSSPNTESS